MIQQQQDEEKLQQFLDAAAGQKEERVQAVNSQQDFQHSMQTMMTEMRKALKKNNNKLACLRLQVDNNKATGGVGAAAKAPPCDGRTKYRGIYIARVRSRPRDLREFYGLSCPLGMAGQQRHTLSHVHKCTAWS